MGWLQDSKTTLLDGRTAAENNVKSQSFCNLLKTDHLWLMRLWHTWKALHCGPTPHFLLLALLVEELSGRGTIEVCEGMARQTHLLPVWDVVVHVRRHESWISVVEVCDHFPVRFLPTLTNLMFLHPSQRLLMWSPLVGWKDRRRSHKWFHFLGC